jgi:CRISP-associated protein Cas1
LLGPGTKITHRAMELISDCGVTVIWVGEQGVRYYAHGRSLANRAALLIKQAELVSNVRKRAAVACKMYEMHFDGENISGLTIQQLRGREGARVRIIYRNASKEYGVPWNGREYDPDNFESSDPVNQALSAAHACLYGVVHSVIVALGCSAGLGFIHVGHERSFVYDIADLYKAEITIPIAFNIAKKALNDENFDVGGETRRAVRDSIASGKILERCARDIRKLLLGDIEGNEDQLLTTDVLHLWDEKRGFVHSGVNYGGIDPEENDPDEEGNGII